MPITNPLFVQYSKKWQCSVIDLAVDFNDAPKDSDVNVTHEGTENFGGKGSHEYLYKI